MPAQKEPKQDYKVIRPNHYPAREVCASNVLRKRRRAYQPQEKGIRYHKRHRHCINRVMLVSRGERARRDKQVNGECGVEDQVYQR